MYRRWHEHILGGVCAGIATRTPLSADAWRVLFVLGTIATGGAFALVYVAWWWLLPAERPQQRPPRAGLNSLIALLWMLFVVGGFVIRYVLNAGLITEDGASLYEPLLLIGMALILFLRQFSLPRGARRAPFFALVLLLMTLVPLLGALALLPEGIYDLLARGAPAVLVFLGLYILLRDRIALPAGLLSALVTVVLVVGMAVLAFSNRATQQRTENTITHTETISPEITLLLVDVETLDTDVTFFTATDDNRQLEATFVGSTESAIEEVYTEAEDGIANLRIIESRESPYPNLQAVGRGRLDVALPVNVAIALTFGGQQGNATFDMAQLDLERLTVDLAQGDVLVTLPDYQPLSPSISENPGQIAVYEGDLRVVIPDDVGGRFVLNRDRALRPQFDETLYLLIDDGADGTLQAIGYEGLERKLRYTLTVPRGQIRLDTRDANSNVDSNTTGDD
jgi:phage shock protein PspC (stress-responsive transcriptional regulator)